MLSSVTTTEESIEVVCCLTSYPVRIKNCYRVLKSLLENTIPPDRIYLTLASSQFPNNLDDLPPLLRRLVVSDPKVHVLWEDVDRKIMMQVLPVLPFLNDSAVIVPIDDDVLYPTDYIESRLKDFEEFGRVPLTGCSTQRGRTLWERWGIPSSIGHACLFQKQHIRNINRFIDDDVMQANNSDGTYSIVEWLNGHVAHDVTKYGMDWLFHHCLWNETQPSRLNAAYQKGDQLLETFSRRVMDLTGICITDPKSALSCHGIFAS